MADVVWSDAALGWLREIHDYIAGDNPGAAETVVQGILDRSSQLAQFPDSGLRLASRGLRHVRLILYGHYRIAYRVRGQDLVEVVGVYHGSLEIARRLRADLRRK